MIALISDVHGNLEALQAVLDDIGDADVICCVGDTVGYGPNPNECCELLRERSVQSVKGNHDNTCATLEDIEPCSSMARQSFHWTHEKLIDQNKEWLRNLPLQLNLDGMSLVHGCPGTPSDMLNTYVLDYFYSHEHYERLLRMVPGRRLVLGHTHIPLSHGLNSKVVNPGSVGQPRDGDWRPAYATVEDTRYSFPLVLDPRASFNMLKDRVVFRRVEYNRDVTACKIEDEPGLPDRLAHILRHGGLRM
ncbi:MAG: metallophosphoesterase family protein [Planctomycetota bacterium]|jgi:predicted phosphodiesterase